jgi:hypothetical protein
MEEGKAAPAERHLTRFEQGFNVGSYFSFSVVFRPAIEIIKIILSGEMIMVKLQAMFKSRRFWVGIGALVVTCAEAFFGEGIIDPSAVQQMTLLVAAWIVGDSLRETA